MSIQSIVRWFVPKEDHFYTYVEQIAGLGYEAAVELAKFGTISGPEVQKSVQTLEHKADDVVRQMEDALARTFVTPIDREDLHRLTSQLDDVVDTTNLTARAYSLYHIEKPSPAMQQIAAKLVECTKVLSTAVPRLRAHQYEQLIEDCRTVRALEKEADAIYRAAISQLFSESHPDFRDLLRQKEALDDLENAVDLCDDAAGFLSNLAVKHG